MFGHSIWGHFQIGPVGGCVACALRVALDIFSGGLVAESWDTSVVELVNMLPCPLCVGAGLRLRGHRLVLNLACACRCSCSGPGSSMLSYVSVRRDSLRGRTRPRAHLEVSHIIVLRPSVAQGTRIAHPMCGIVGLVWGDCLSLQGPSSAPTQLAPNASAGHSDGIGRIVRPDTRPQCMGEVAWYKGNSLGMLPNAVRSG